MFNLYLIKLLLTYQLPPCRFNLQMSMNSQINNFARYCTSFLFFFRRDENTAIEDSKKCETLYQYDSATPHSSIVFYCEISGTIKCCHMHFGESKMCPQVGGQNENKMMFIIQKIIQQISQLLQSMQTIDILIDAIQFIAKTVLRKLFFAFSRGISVFSF